MDNFAIIIIIIVYNGKASEILNIKRMYQENYYCKKKKKVQTAGLRNTLKGV